MYGLCIFILGSLGSMGGLTFCGKLAFFYDLDLLSCGRDPFRSFIGDLGSDVQAGLKDTDCSKVGSDF